LILVFADKKRFSPRFAEKGPCLPLSEGVATALMLPPFSSAATVKGESVPKQSKRATRKVTCEDCYFRRNLLCALELAEPCATFRPAEAQLAPPQQLRFVFRQERRSRAAWAFPSAQEQAALHA
jgi:hypothetical protein